MQLVEERLKITAFGARTRVRVILRRMSAQRRIYLGNLPYSATAQEVLDFLGLSKSAESAVELVCSRDRPQRRLGFGFVSVSPDKVEQVLACNGSSMGERKIKVSLARESDQSKPGKWQPAAGQGPKATVMVSRTKKGIPQDVLDSLAALRIKLEKKSVDSPQATPSGAAKPDSPPLLVDVGANLTNFRFRGQLEDVLERSLAAGVHKIIVTGTSAEGSQMGMLLARTLPGVLYCTAGLHPHTAKNWSPEVQGLLEMFLLNPEVVAVGETGLDYNRMLSTMDEQRDAFAAQVELACRVQKPLFVHEREAHSDLVKILSSSQDKLPPVLIHCFTGTGAEAKTYIEMGYYIGLTGFVCKQERGKVVRELLKNKTIPLERLVLETDCPFMLPPLPSSDYNGLDGKGRNNEPCTLPLVAATVAEQCGVSVEEVAHTTTSNALSLFRL